MKFEKNRRSLKLSSAIKTLHNIVSTYEDRFALRECIHIIYSYAAKSKRHREFLSNCGINRLILYLLQFDHIRRDFSITFEMLLILLWTTTNLPPYGSSNTESYFYTDSSTLNLCDTLPSLLYYHRKNTPIVLVIMKFISALCIKDKRVKSYFNQIEILRILCEVLLLNMSYPKVVKSICQIISIFETSVSVTIPDLYLRACVCLFSQAIRNDVCVHTGLLLCRYLLHFRPSMDKISTGKLCQSLVHVIRHSAIGNKRILKLSCRTLVELIDTQPTCSKYLLDQGCFEELFSASVKPHFRKKKKVLERLFHAMISLLPAQVQGTFPITMSGSGLAFKVQLRSVASVRKKWIPLFLQQRAQIRWERRKQFAKFLSGCKLLFNAKAPPPLTLILSTELATKPSKRYPRTVVYVAFFSLKICGVIASFL